MSVLKGMRSVRGANKAAVMWKGTAGTQEPTVLRILPSFPLNPYFKSLPVFFFLIFVKILFIYS